MDKIKITLACAFGASTAAICNSMIEAAKKNNLDVDVKAIPTTEAIKEIANSDCILLAPQVRYEKKRFEKEAEKTGTPILAIPSDLYGACDGIQILGIALKEVLNKRG